MSYPHTLFALAALAALSAAVSTTHAQPPAPEGASEPAAVENAAQPQQSDPAPSPAEEEEKIDPRTNRAIELYSAGDVEGAYELFKQIHDSDPDSDPPGVLLALLHSHAGKFLEMRRALEQTAEDYPNDPETFLQLANIDVQEGRFLEARLLIERAEKLLESYQENHPETTTRLTYLKQEALNARATLAEKRGRYDEAKTIVKKIVESAPEDAQAHWNLGYLSMKLQQYEEAEKAYDRAAELNPGLWPGWLQVATALDREDLIEEGKARIEQRKDEIANAPKDQRAQIARLYLRWYMMEEAATIVDGFVQDNQEKDLDRWLLSGWISLYANRYAAAEASFRNATLVDPESFEASNGLALALLDQRNKEKLANAYAIALKNYRVDPDNYDAAVTYAWTLFLMGNHKEADEIFGAMLSSGKTSATVAYYLAEIAYTRGDVNMANTLLRLALTQKANFPKRIAAKELQTLINGEEETSPFDDFDDEAFPDEEEKEATEDPQAEEKPEEEK